MNEHESKPVVVVALKVVAAKRNSVKSDECPMFSNVLDVVTATAVVEAVDVEAVDVEAVDVEAVDVEAVDVEAVDVEAVDVEAVDVEAVDVEAVDVEAVDVEAVDVEASIADEINIFPFLIMNTKDMKHTRVSACCDKSCRRSGGRS